MRVVSDTTAVTTLLKAEQGRLLQDMFGRVFVPQAVWVELEQFHTELPGFVELRPLGGSTLNASDHSSGHFCVFGLIQLRFRGSIGGCDG